MALDGQLQQKLLLKHGQISYVWSKISKTISKIFLAQILRKLQIDGIGQQEQNHKCNSARLATLKVKVKSFKKDSQIGYIWSKISTTVFKIS